MYSYMNSVTSSGTWPGYGLVWRNLAGVWFGQAGVWFGLAGVWFGLAGVWFGLAEPLEQHTIPINLNRTSRLSKGEGRLALSKISSQKIRQTLKKILFFKMRERLNFPFSLQ